MAKKCATCEQWRKTCEALKKENGRNKEALRELSLELDKLREGSHDV